MVYSSDDNSMNNLYSILGGVFYAIGLTMRVAGFAPATTQYLFIASILILVYGVIAIPEKRQPKKKMYTDILTAVAGAGLIAAIFTAIQDPTGVSTVPEIAIYIAFIAYGLSIVLSPYFTVWVQSQFDYKMWTLLTLGLAYIGFTGGLFISGTGSNMFNILAGANAIAAAVLYIIGKPLMTRSLLTDDSLLGSVKKTDLNVETKIGADKLPMPSASGGVEFTYNFTTYISAHQPKKNGFVPILRRDPHLSVMYNSGTNEMMVNVPTPKPSGGNYDNAVIIPNFPQQAWTSVGIVINQRRVGIYLNGAHYTSMDLRNVARLAAGELKVGNAGDLERGSYIHILRYAARAQTPAEMEYIGNMDREASAKLTSDTNILTKFVKQ